MAAATEQVLFDHNFQDSQLPSELQWLNKPQKVDSAASGDRGIRIFSDAKSDFWQKTYYEPLLQADNGHLLYYSVDKPKVVMEADMKVVAANQFDQGGLMVYIDTDHWIKTGLEYVDGVYQLSCVVTNVYSDWSCQAWSGPALSLRLWKIGDSYVVESKDSSSDKWTFFRIAHLDHGSSGDQVKMGVFTAAPKDAGTYTLVKHLNLKTTSGHSHHS